MKEFDFYFTVPCSFSYVIKAKSEKEAREKLLTGDYEGDLDLKENKMNDVIEELEKKFTIKDLNTILNHITFWLYKNINDKYTDEFVQVDNLALLRSIKKLKDDIVNKKFERYIKREPDWWHGGSD